MTDAADIRPAPPPAAKPAGRPGEIATALLVVGLISAVVGGYRWYTGYSAEVAPREITMGGLLADGPGDNRHVRITGGVIGSPRFLLTYELGSYWQVVPEGGPVGGKYTCVMAVQSAFHSLWDDDPTASFPSKKALQGVVLEPSSRERAAFQKHGITDFLVLIEGRRPAGTYELLIYAALSAGCLGLGAWLTERERADPAKTTSPG